MSKVITPSFCHLQVREKGGRMGGGAPTQRPETPSLKSIYKDFSSAQSLWAISTCSNPPPPLRGRPDIRPKDLSVYLSVCLRLNPAAPSLVGGSEREKQEQKAAASPVATDVAHSPANFSLNCPSHRPSCLITNAGCCGSWGSSSMR